MEMRNKVIAYMRVYVDMMMQGMNLIDLATASGISYVSMRRKLRGESPWFLEECIAVKEALHSDLPIETLFEKRE